MALVTPETKLCDVIIDEPSVIPVINRFDISLGVGDKTVKAICESAKIDLAFFLTILNAYLYETFYPEAGTVSFGARETIDYLQKTNQSYLRNQLPNIERHFNALIEHSDKNNNLPLLFQFYKEVKAEIVHRIEDDSRRWFVEILELERSAGICNVLLPAEGMEVAADSIEDKLNDLKNMFVIHLRGEYDRNLCHAVLFAIISLEKDIKQNNRIRKRVLRPLALALEKASKNQ